MPFLEHSGAKRNFRNKGTVAVLRFRIGRNVECTEKQLTLSRENR
jgi:hypothetical protein